MIPCVGAGITVVLPKKHFDSERARKIRRAYVTETGDGPRGHGSRIQWKSGSLTGETWEEYEGVEWIHGHGPQARAALLVARGLG